MNTIPNHNLQSAEELTDLLGPDLFDEMPLSILEQDFSECLKDVEGGELEEDLIPQGVVYEEEKSLEVKEEEVGLESSLSMDGTMPIVIQMLEKPVEPSSENRILQKSPEAISDNLDLEWAHENEILEREVMHENAILNSPNAFLPLGEVHIQNETVENTELDSQIQNDQLIEEIGLPEIINNNASPSSLVDASRVLDDKTIQNVNDTEQSFLTSISKDAVKDDNGFSSSVANDEVQIEDFDGLQELDIDKAPVATQLRIFEGDLPESHANESEPRISENIIPSSNPPQESLQANLQASPQVASINYDLKPSLLQHLSYLEDHQPATLKVNLKLDPQGNASVDMQVKLTASGKLQVNFESMAPELQELTQSAWNDLKPTILSKGWSLDGPHFDGVATKATDQIPSDSLGIKNFLKNFLQSPLSKGIVPKALARFRSDRGSLEKAEPNFQ